MYEDFQEVVLVSSHFFGLNNLAEVIPLVYLNAVVLDFSRCSNDEKNMNVEKEESLLLHFSFQSFHAF